MPRSSTSSKQAAPFRYNPPKIKMPAPPPMPYKPAAPPMVLPQVQQPTMMQSMKDGFGLGLGSSIAHNVVGRMFGAPAYTPNKPSSDSAEKKPCAAELREFENCFVSSDTTFCGDKQNTYVECIKQNK